MRGPSGGAGAPGVAPTTPLVLEDLHSTEVTLGEF